MKWNFNIKILSVEISDMYPWPLQNEVVEKVITRIKQSELKANENKYALI